MVADLVRAAGHTVAGYADADQTKWGAVVEPGGATVVISEAALVQLLEQGSSLPCRATAIALALGDNESRLRTAKRAARALMPALVHPASTISESAQLGAGTVVFAGAIVNAAARIGCAAIINTAAIVEHDCTVGDGAHIAPGAVLTGGVSVGQASLVGARSVVLPGVTIEADVVVGAGAVVAGDVGAGMVVAGVPARVLRERAT